MANTKSAMKRIRQSENRRIRNRTVRSKVRTAVKTARTAVTEAGGDARTAVLEAIRALDKAVTKGVIHPNTAGRKKSALARRLVAHK
ncbi:MAG: 30S ribosomal protein S20 [Candidatus Rokubacteria bacterium 13_1_20CM_2_68_19]|nr:MAG: 30S ribosomal protein S20 [Candidatus Rokubacteria bacterium 13_1_40CM_4_67_11]OLD31398.1 MAG: 30S ribosomal protein S20 [Candidatus Rokubacteria bacterium 13_1_40CM_2_68_13]OLD99748.1 MAG: 30S ribosomal protein S20 [Candidatus Rokubacteria bacterium 13_1_20CM_4_68_9]OLE43267.1 MAG: 30S ribosomal protein S20 [Candidatus Rokubacteria bacterium 13_1_20CM_2_68_19]PYN63963.1 MAG: 30S ribosomal protein S20 [Candidatus Rokubacteria bacterium]